MKKVGWMVVGAVALVFIVAVIYGAFCFVKSLAPADTSQVPTIEELVGETEEVPAWAQELLERMDAIAIEEGQETVGGETTPTEEALVVIVDGELVCEGPGIAEPATEDGTPIVVRVDKAQKLTFADGIYWCGPEWFSSQAALNRRWEGHVTEFFDKPENKEGLALVIKDGKLVPDEETQATDLGEVAVVTPEPSEEEPVPGDIAFNHPTDAETWEATDVGQLGSKLPILAEIWGKVNGKNKGFVVVIPPGAVAWFQHHYGGIGWWIAPVVDLHELAEEHADSIEATDGTRPTIVFLPDDWFPLLGCLQTKAIENGIRVCDAVGDRVRFTMEAGHPFPGYFPDPN